MKKLLQELCGFIIIIITVQNSSASEDTCTTPDALLGSCIILQECTFIQKSLENTTTASARNQLLHSYHCGFDGSLPKVCCPPHYPIASATSTEQPDEDLPDIRNHQHLKLLDLTGCGIYSYDKIFRGDQVDPDSFPWMALISYKSRTGLSFRCSGTLINKNYILTAAHCITGITSIKLAGVRLGEYNILTDPDCSFEAGGEYCSPPVQDFAIGEIIPHPSYNTTKYGHDIGLIRLEQPAVLTDSVRPICLPTKHDNDFKADTYALVTGWGVTETGYSSPRLLKVRLPVITNAKCQQRYNEIKAPIMIGLGQVCAGGVAGKDTCAGDGGGPLGRMHRGDSRFTQYGIVSFGSRFCGLESLPGVYTRVAHYMDWILDNIRA